jgi:FPC/CPF motif-containing protein YcgG
VTAAPVVRVHGLPVLRAPGREPQPWWEQSAARLVRDVGSAGYPCHFGRVALARDELFATFFDEPGPELAWSLREFLDLSRPAPERRMVLAAFRRPAGARPHTWYEKEFWRTLQDLHDRDEVAWPADIPTSPAHPSWEFSFGGVPMFAFSAAPTHDRRRSRNLGDGLVVLFQPRTVFADVMGGTPGGIKARRTIRRRLAEWDTTAAHRDLGDYGDPSNFEWRQYFIADDDTRMRERCPLRLRAAPEKGP